MKQLLDNRLAPITFGIGFIECSFERAIAEYDSWSRTILRNIAVSRVNGSFEEALLRLLPLSMPVRRTLLFATQRGWTAYFDNGISGPDPLSAVSTLCARLDCRGLIVRFVPHTLNTEAVGERGTYGAVQFQLFANAPRAFLNLERSVSLSYDSGGWRFYASGGVQPFEDVAKYEARRVRDRFPGELLERYCNALEVYAFDDSFYTGPGWLTSFDDLNPQQGRVLSLDDARHAAGIVP